MPSCCFVPNQWNYLVTKDKAQSPEKQNLPLEGLWTFRFSLTLEGSVCIQHFWSCSVIERLLVWRTAEGLKHHPSDLPRSLDSPAILHVADSRPGRKVFILVTSSCLRLVYDFLITASVVPHLPSLKGKFIVSAPLKNQTKTNKTASSLRKNVLHWNCSKIWPSQAALSHALLSAGSTFVVHFNKHANRIINMFWPPPTPGQRKAYRPKVLLACLA